MSEDDKAVFFCNGISQISILLCLQKNVWKWDFSTLRYFASSNNSSLVPRVRSFGICHKEAQVSAAAAAVSISLSLAISGGRMRRCTFTRNISGQFFRGRRVQLENENTFKIITSIFS
jgi:hypothetical protein